MKRRLKKTAEKKGFTLAELLAVVAIIGVLVAISIPIFSGQLEKAREATDAANIRSQYAVVLTDAITDGGNVNQSHAAYAPIVLRQRVDRWQDTSMQSNLESVFGKVFGYPKADGQAWVEYDAKEQYAILHYEDAGGNSSGGGSSTDESETPQSTTAAPPETPVTKPAQPETSSTEPKESEPTVTPLESTTATEPSTSEGQTDSDVINKIKQTAGDWPTPGKSESLTEGKAFRLQDGSIYISTITHDYNKYDQSHYPTEKGFEWMGVKPSGTVIASAKIANGNLTVSVHYGDILEGQDGNYYIWKNTWTNSYEAPVNDGNWLKLNLD